MCVCACVCVCVCVVVYIIGISSGAVKYANCTKRDR